MCTETITLFKDIILIGVAVTGAVVAVKGLSTWKKQLTGHADYDLARRLLVSVFKYRDAIDTVRHPAMWNNEMPYPPKDQADKISDDQIRFYGISNAYLARWDKVREIRSDLYADLLDTEALWGTALNDIFKVAFTLEHELFTNIRQYLVIINPDTKAAKRNAVERIFEKKRDVIYDELGEEPDEFKKEFREAVKKIEAYLKQKLSR